MKLKTFDNTGLFLPCNLFKRYKSQRKSYWYKNGTSKAKSILRHMLKVEKDAKKWTYEREDENYLYYKWERKKGTTYYKMDKKYWKEELC